MPLMSGLREIIRQPAWVLFAISTFILSAASNGMSNFLGVTIKEMGGPDTPGGHHLDGGVLMTPRFRCCCSARRCWGRLGSDKPWPLLLLFLCAADLPVRDHAHLPKWAPGH